MINIICFLASFGIIGLVLNCIQNSIKADVFYVLCGVFVIVFTVWAIAITCFIRDVINAQLKDWYDIPGYKKWRKSYTVEMEEYKEEMQKELLEKYRKFEETLMNSIKDSNLIATVLKQSGYAQVLKSYNNRIERYLSDIHSCDRSIETCIRKMMVRQNEFLSGYGFFISKKFIYREKEE